MSPGKPQILLILCIKAADRAKSGDWFKQYRQVNDLMTAYHSINWFCRIKDIMIPATDESTLLSLLSVCLLLLLFR